MRLTTGWRAGGQQRAGGQAGCWASSGTLGLAASSGLLFMIPVPHEQQCACAPGHLGQARRGGARRGAAVTAFSGGAAGIKEEADKQTRSHKAGGDRQKRKYVRKQGKAAGAGRSMAGMRAQRLPGPRGPGSSLLLPLASSSDGRPHGPGHSSLRCLLAATRSPACPASVAGVQAARRATPCPCQVSTTPRSPPTASARTSAMAR